MIVLVGWLVGWLVEFSQCWSKETQHEIGMVIEQRANDLSEK
jgi:hypothetical protein